MLKKGLLFLLVLGLALLLCTGAVTAEEGAELQELPAEAFAETDELLSRYVFGTYYTWESTENAKADGYSVENEWGSYEDTGIELAGERVKDHATEVISGDAFLEGALVFRRNMKTRQLLMGVDPNFNWEEGEAVIRLTLESEHYRFVKDYTLRMVPFPENAFEPKKGGEIVITPGMDYTVQDLAEMTGTLAPELAANLRNLRFTKKSVVSCGTMEDLLWYFQTEKQEARTGELQLICANASVRIPKVKVKQGIGLIVQGPGVVCPGAEAMYSVTHSKGKSAVPGDCVLTAEGAEISPEGVLTVGEDAQPGDRITVTAASEEAGLKTSMVLTVAESVRLEPEWTELTVHGVTIPVPYLKKKVKIPEPKQYESDKKEGKTSAYDNIMLRIGELEGFLHYDVYIIPKNEKHDGDVAGTLENWKKEDGLIRDIGYMSVNGCRAAYVTRYADADRDYVDWNGLFVAVIGKYRLGLSCGLMGSPRDGALQLNKAFLMDLISRIRIEDQPVEIIDHEPAPEVIQEEGITETGGGSTVRYRAVEEPGYGKVVWEITDEKGGKTKAATVNGNGVVKAGNVKQPEKVVIKARYQKCMQTSEKVLKIWPGVKKITIQASDTVLYLDSGNSVTLTVSQDPADTRLFGLAWSVSKAGIAELKDNGDGTAVLTPLSPGTVTVTAAEASGKKGTVKITVK